MIVAPLDRLDPAETIWENLPMDQELGPLETTISDHDVKSYGYAVDDLHPWYLHDSPPAAESSRPPCCRSLCSSFAISNGTAR